MHPIANGIANELNLSQSSVQKVIELLEEGNTIPFIARYRKEATGNLDEVQIRNIEEKHTYITELEARRQTILATIEKQGKLTPELKKQILQATEKTALEDLYLPYKPKRRTRSTIAKEKGLEPLALMILEQGKEGLDAGKPFITEEVADLEEAWKGARDIVAELVSEKAEVRQLFRELYHEEGVIVSHVTKDFKDKKTKFDQYVDFREKVSTIPSHRFLAIRRGERESVLIFHIEVEVEEALRTVEAMMHLNLQSPLADQLRLAIQDAYKRLISPSVETDVRIDLKMRSDTSAVEVFADNLRNLLMAAPLGGKSVIGIDPGLRTGCKCVAVDATGKYLESTTLFLHRQTTEAEHALLAFLHKHRPLAVAVGNGTGGREAESFVRKICSEYKIETIVTSVNEAGASVYSASDIAREEFPDLDLTLRGAISIGRRLQDPLAELVKVEPKSIGVGQYQHDVQQSLLGDKLGAVVESCVNQVGVELNTASAPLLSYVAGIGPSLAQKIVSHRNENGPFRERNALLSVKGMGAKSFEQAAGFLRVAESSNPLDHSAVHPEQYGVVEKMVGAQGLTLDALVGNEKEVSKLDLSKWSAEVGEYTLRDIVEELAKPGRDPRAEFEPPKFRDDVNEMKDLKEGMQLEGVITNVTAFGAFVDIGVHQDGLVHISALSDRFVKDPREVVKVGQKIKVRVIEVDLDRKRIALSAKGEEPKKARKAQASFAASPFASL